MDNLTTSSLEAAIPFLAGIIGIVIGFKKGRISGSISEKAKKLLRWVSLPLIGFSIFLFVNGFSEPVDVEVLVQGIKAKLKLPAQIDDATRLDDVRAISKMEMGYFLTLTRVTKSQLDDNLLAKQLESHLRSGACQNPNYLRLFKAGINVRMTYQTLDKDEVARIVMVPKDCGF